MDTGARWAAVHSVTKSWTQLKQLSTQLGLQIGDIKLELRKQLRDKEDLNSEWLSFTWENLSVPMRQEEGEVKLTQKLHDLWCYQVTKGSRRNSGGENGKMVARGRSDQIRSVAHSCPTLCNPMNRSTPGLPVHHQLPEFTETHVHWVSDAIQPSHPLSSRSPLAPNPSQHQSLPMSQLFAKVLEFQL